MVPSLKSLETDASLSTVSQLSSPEDTTSEDSVIGESVRSHVFSPHLGTNTLTRRYRSLCHHR